MCAGGQGPLRHLVARYKPAPAATEAPLVCSRVGNGLSFCLRCTWKFCKFCGLLCNLNKYYNVVNSAVIVCYIIRRHPFGWLIEVALDELSWWQQKVHRCESSGEVMMLRCGRSGWERAGRRIGGREWDARKTVGSKVCSRRTLAFPLPCVHRIKIFSK